MKRYNEFVLPIKKTAVEDLGNCFLTEQVFAVFLFELPPSLVDAATGNDGMDMGVEGKLPAVGVKSQGHAQIGSQVFRFFAEV